MIKSLFARIIFCDLALQSQKKSGEEESDDQTA